MKKQLSAVLCTAGAGICAFGYYFIRAEFIPTVEKPQTDKKRIACVGDSITYGTGVVVTRKKHAYPYILQELVGDKYEVLNYGFNDRALQNEADLPYTKEKMYKASLDCKADVYTIMLGSNDTKPKNWNAERYERELEEFAKQYIDIAGADRVFLMKPPANFKILGIEVYGIRVREVAELSEIVQRVADRLNCRTIDMYSLTKDHKSWFIDGVHPAVRGNRAMAEFIYDSIKDVL